MQTPVPCVLRSPWLTLRPGLAEDAEALRACCDSTTFVHFITHVPESLEPEAFGRFWRGALADPGLVTFVAEQEGTPVGTSSYLDIRTAHRGLEIGFTFLAPSVRGTSANPAMKRLMLGHAFEDLGAARVQLKCDALNARSRAAILKLGCTFEGILRQHGVRGDGSLRDTAMYSLIRSEWPAARERLDARLTARPAPASE